MKEQTVHKHKLYSNVKVDPDVVHLSTFSGCTVKYDLMIGFHNKNAHHAGKYTVLHNSCKKGLCLRVTMTVFNVLLVYF